MSYAQSVSEPIREHTIVVGLVDDLLLIKRERVWSDGTRVGGDFMIDPRNVGWLADQLELAADEKISETTHDAEYDHLNVFVRGGEHGTPINIHVHNDREAIAVHGKTYVLSGMYPKIAYKLAADLRAHKPA